MMHAKTFEENKPSNQQEEIEGDRLHRVGSYRVLDITKDTIEKDQI